MKQISLTFSNLGNHSTSEVEIITLSHAALDSWKQQLKKDREYSMFRAICCLKKGIHHIVWQNSECRVILVLLYQQDSQTAIILKPVHMNEHKKSFIAFRSQRP